MKLAAALALVVLGSSHLGCGGSVDDDKSDQSPVPSRVPPPPANGRLFVLRIDGRTIELEPPTATRFVPKTEGVPAYVSIDAEQDSRGGDYTQSASVTLNGPFTTGTFDCTPNDEGDWVNSRATFTPGFFEFKAKLTDCTVTVTYIADDRAVGSFSVKGHPPDGSSLGGTVSTAEGEFDVPIEKEVSL